MESFGLYQEDAQAKDQWILRSNQRVGWKVSVRVRVHTDPGKSSKVMEFKIQFSEAWKVMEINQILAAFLTRVRLHTLSLSTVGLSSICCLV